MCWVHFTFYTSSQMFLLFLQKFIWMYLRTNNCLFEYQTNSNLLSIRLRKFFLIILIILQIFQLFTNKKWLGSLKIEKKKLKENFNNSSTCNFCIKIFSKLYIIHMGFWIFNLIMQIYAYNAFFFNVDSHFKIRILPTKKWSQRNNNWSYPNEGNHTTNCAKSPVVDVMNMSHCPISK